MRLKMNQGTMPETIYVNNIYIMSFDPWFRNTWWNKSYVGGKVFVCFLYLILMGLRASSSCHINKARNWIAKPMLVKLAIRNCFW